MCVYALRPMMVEMMYDDGIIHGHTYAYIDCKVERTKDGLEFGCMRSVGLLVSVTAHYSSVCIIVL